MLYKKLGNTETLISAIGQSSFAAGDKKSSNSLTIKKYIDVLHYGIDLGMNFVDTAESYEDGHSEVILGKAITGIREKVFIASSCRRQFKEA